MTRNEISRHIIHVVQNKKKERENPTRPNNSTQARARWASIPCTTAHEQDLINGRIKSTIFRLPPPLAGGKTQQLLFLKACGKKKKGQADRQSDAIH